MLARVMGFMAVINPLRLPRTWIIGDNSGSVGHRKDAVAYLRAFARDSKERRKELRRINENPTYSTHTSYKTRFSWKRFVAVDTCAL